MQKIYRTLSTLSLIMLASPLVAYAQLSKPTNSYGLAYGSVSSVITRALYVLLTVVGSLALLMIIVSGIMYITSGGDSGRTETAKSWLVYSVVGLVVVLVSYVIVASVSTAFGV